MTETEILGQLDALLGQLPDDAARERAFAWLRAKHAAKPVAAAPAPTVNPPTWVPMPVTPSAPHPDLGPTIWWTANTLRNLDCAANLAGYNGVTSPGDVWIGETMPTAEALASGFRPSGMHS